MRNSRTHERKILPFPAAAGAADRGTQDVITDAGYVELSTMTNYSFLEAASHADELALSAIAQIGRAHV